MENKCWADTVTEAEKLAAYAGAAACAVNREELHTPSRADHLESVEDHLIAAAGLARALWLAISGLDDIDPCDQIGINQLASSVADHASAARFAFYRDAALKADGAAKAAAAAERDDAAKTEAQS